MGEFSRPDALASVRVLDIERLEIFGPPFGR
jgi:hypothetical protein